MVGSMSPIPPSLWQLLLQTAQHDQNFVFLNQTWGPLTYITAHIEPHMQTAAGHQLLRQTAPPETYSKFKYRMKKKNEKKTQRTFLESHSVQNRSISKGNLCRNSASCHLQASNHCTDIFVMQCTLDGGMSGRQANQSLVVGWENKQKVDGMCQEGSQCCIRPAMTNITTSETLVVCFTADGLDG